MRILFASLLLAAACNSAYADRVAVAQVGPRIALAVSPDKVRAPYDVQIVSESGETQPTFAQKGRYYVLGNDGDRYTIRVTNPTGNRVEAVVSVDGLDVVDGEEGDLRKRGYIVPAYGEVRIEGFRTSLSDVATFRFSSVDNSYAGKKGKARNVGVIAVAIFEEAAPPPDQQIVAPEVARRNMDRDWGTDEEEGQASMDAPRGRTGGGGRVAHHAAKADKKAAQAETTVTVTGHAPSIDPGSGRAATRPAPPPAANGAGVTGGAPAPKAAESRRESAAMDDGDYYEPPTEQVAPKTGRAGLGTEFGESRYSAAAYTKFVRANNRPIAIAELRYNDRSGLVALGIPLEPSPDENEIMMRETADPFPGDGRFATPPR